MSTTTTKPYPQGDAYLGAIQNPDIAFTDPTLKTATVERDGLGLPRVRSGGFVFTFHLTLRDGREKALRCFNQRIDDQLKRYAAISAYLKSAPAGLFSAVDYQEQGMLVRGDRYPILMMDWVRGTTLNAWVESHLIDKQALRSLETQFDGVLSRLAQLHVAHGDLQHGNILIDAQGTPHLIDYDGMYVPALSGNKANERGHKNYQHPLRNQEFNEQLDRFAGIVIVLALRALQSEPSLWSQFARSGENMLFTQDDFLDPLHSHLLARLEQIPSCQALIPGFRKICQGSLSSVPASSAFFAPKPLEISQSTRLPLPWTPTIPISDALDTDRLRQYVGQMVEVVGQIREVRRKQTRDGRDYCQVLFSGAYNFALLVFEDGLANFASARQYVEHYQGEWVSISQYLGSFAGNPDYPPRPQMIIEYPAQIGIISQGEAKQRLAAKNMPIAPPRPPDTQPPPAPPRVPDIRPSWDSQKRPDPNGSSWGPNDEYPSISLETPNDQGSAGTSPCPPVTVKPAWLQQEQPKHTPPTPQNPLTKQTSLSNGAIPIPPNPPQKRARSRGSRLITGVITGIILLIIVYLAYQFSITWLLIVLMVIVTWFLRKRRR